MPPRKTCASTVVVFCFTTTFKPYYSSIFGTTLVALSSLQPYAWSLWSFICFRICCSHLCTLPFVLLYVSFYIRAFIYVFLFSFHVMLCSICSFLYYLGSFVGAIFLFNIIWGLFFSFFFNIFIIYNYIYYFIFRYLYFRFIIYIYEFYMVLSRITIGKLHKFYGYYIYFIIF